VLTIVKQRALWFTFIQGTRQLEFNVKDVASGTEELVFSMSAFSAGAEQTPQDNNYNVTLSFVTQTDIGLSG
jgi:hypothetical protein